MVIQARTTRTMPPASQPEITATAQECHVARSSVTATPRTVARAMRESAKRGRHERASDGRVPPARTVRAGPAPASFLQPESRMLAGMTGPGPDGQFAWEDPLNLDAQLAEDERHIRDMARSYAQD